MLREIKIDCRFFLNQSPAEMRRSRKGLLWILEGMIRVNLEFLKAYPLQPRGPTPSLYQSSVIYEKEKGEIFQDIPATLALGHGDCDDLTIWRVAELNYIGIRALPWIKWPDDEESRMHALVRLPDGRCEDPSLALGMHGSPVIRKPIYVSPT